MDFTLMIIFKDGTMNGGYGATSQLKSFSTREMAEQVSTSIKEQSVTVSGSVQVLKLYL